MRTDDFDYPLPDELIAQAPRGAARLVPPPGAAPRGRFRRAPSLHGRARLPRARRPARGQPHARHAGAPRGAQARDGRRLRDAPPQAPRGRRRARRRLGVPGQPRKRLRQPGTVIEYRAGGLHAPESAPVVLTGEIVDFVEGSKGGRLVRFSPAGEKDDGSPRTLDEAIHAAGHVPLPPYITQYEGDPEKYQTVYAMSEEHSAAAPTAGGSTSRRSSSSASARRAWAGRRSSSRWASTRSVWSPRTTPPST